MNTVPCPICQKAVEWSPESLFRPFCSERCRIRDLGAWANNAYAIPVKFSHEAEDSGENVMQIQENDPNPK